MTASFHRTIIAFLLNLLLLLDTVLLAELTREKMMNPHILSLKLTDFAQMQIINFAQMPIDH